MDGPTLRVRDVHARVVDAPLATPVRTASGSVTRALLVLIRPVDGMLTAPTRPGFGLAWEEAAVRRYALD